VVDVYCNVAAVEKKLEFWSNIIAVKAQFEVRYATNCNDYVVQLFVINTELHRKVLFASVSFFQSFTTFTFNFATPDKPTVTTFDATDLFDVESATTA
jgi:hypothetical protein